MAVVTVDGNAIEIAPGAKNLVQAARQAGVEIPHYCWHEALSVVASCRMCLVEVGEKKPDGTIAMQPKLVPACQTPAKDGTVVITQSAKVKQSQRATLEYLLLNHPLDCPTCDQAGECLLQDYSFRYGNPETRLREPKIQKPDKPHIGEHITLFTDRCIMCTRCVRFTREISGTAELQVIHRGAHEEIDTFLGIPCNNALAGNVVDICPVGALCSKDFLYKQRVWWLRTKPSVCPDCATGCSIHVDQNHDTIYRLRPRPNPQGQGHFMCDLGRFGFHYIHSSTRLKEPTIRRDGVARRASWDELIGKVRGDLEDWCEREPAALAIVFSPFMTLEEGYLLAHWIRGLSREARLVLGPVREVGQDDEYPKDVHGKPRPPIKFTIRKEKCPNRRGIEGILAAFGPDFLSFADLLSAVDSGLVRAVYAIGGDPAGWTSAAAKCFARLEWLAVQDILPSPLSERANYVLPSGGFAEREGTFVQHAGLAQRIERAIHPPDEARPDGRILWDLVGRRGLFHAETIREEMARELDGFAELADAIPADGVFLKSLKERADSGKQLSSASK